MTDYIGQPARDPAAPTAAAMNDLFLSLAAACSIWARPVTQREWLDEHNNARADQLTLDEHAWKYPLRQLLLNQRVRSHGPRNQARTYRPADMAFARDYYYSKPGTEDPPPFKPRVCLRCRDQFMSEGAGNHVCGRCKLQRSWKQG